MTWLPQLMTELRVPLEGALQLALVLNAGGVIGSLSTGFVATRLGSLRTLGCAGLICAAMLILIPSGLVSGAGLMVLVTVLGMVAPTTQNLVNALVAEIVPAQSRAVSLGRTLGVGRLGAITAPLIGSWLLAHIPRGSGLQGEPARSSSPLPVCVFSGWPSPCCSHGVRATPVPRRSRTKSDDDVVGSSALFKVSFTTFLSAGRAGRRASARRACRDPWRSVLELQLSGNPQGARHGSSAGLGPGVSNSEEGDADTEKSSRPSPVNNALSVVPRSLKPPLGATSCSLSCRSRYVVVRC